MAAAFAGHSDRVIGVYELLFPDGSFYVGASTNCMLRIRDHIRYARANRNTVPRVQLAWNKHGQLEWRILIRCSTDRLHELETWCIQQFAPALNCEHTGWHLPDEQRMKLSRAQIGIPKGPYTEERKRNISKALRGRCLSEEHKLKLSLAGKRRYNREL